jgi:hypothetical protein
VEPASERDLNGMRGRKKQMKWVYIFRVRVRYVEIRYVFRELRLRRAK